MLECLRRLSHDPGHLANFKICDPTIFRKSFIFLVVYDFSDAVSLFLLILHTYLSCSVIVIAMKIMSPKIILDV